MRAACFGCFDLFHPGHRFFLSEAKKYGDHLTVIVTRDDMIQLLKRRSPIDDEATRLHNVKSMECVDEVVLGDIDLGGYQVLRTVNPDIIVCGYDQDKLKESLKETFPSTPVVMVDAYQPGIYSTTRLRSRFPN